LIAAAHATASVHGRGAYTANDGIDAEHNTITAGGADAADEIAASGGGTGNSPADDRVGDKGDARKAAIAAGSDYRRPEAGGRPAISIIGARRGCRSTRAHGHRDAGETAGQQRSRK
jgi:hypothetical protein